MIEPTTWRDMEGGFDAPEHPKQDVVRSLYLGSSCLHLLFFEKSLTSSAADAELRWLDIAPPTATMVGEYDEGFAAMDVDADVDFPSLVSDVLRKLGLNKTELASVLGVTRQSIYDWLKSRHTPDPLRQTKLIGLRDVTARLSAPMSRAVLRQQLFDGESLLDLLHRDDPRDGTLQEAVGRLEQASRRRQERSLASTFQRLDWERADESERDDAVRRNIDEFHRRQRDEG